MQLLSTIWHTGTHSAAAHFFGDWQEKIRNNELIWRHCEPDVFDIHAKRIITMYRDPRRVAESWARRGLFKNAGFRPRHVKTWEQQWEIWAGLVPIAEVHSVSELPIRLASHPNRENSIIPEGIIEYADERVERVKKYLPFDLVTG